MVQHPRNNISIIIAKEDRTMALKSMYNLQKLFELEFVDNPKKQLLLFLLLKLVLMSTKIRHIHQGGRGHWAVYYTSLQSSIIKFSNLLAYQLWGHFIEFWLVQGWFNKLSVQTFQPLFIERIILCIIIGDVHQFTFLYP